MNQEESVASKPGSSVEGASVPTVFEFFVSELGVAPIDDQGLYNMAIDTPCGADCAAAISAAKGLLAHVQNAHGHHRPDLAAGVVNAAKSVVDVYIYG